jgi:hypothetical protein
MNTNNATILKALEQLANKFPGMYNAPYLDEQNVYGCGYIDPQEVPSRTGKYARLFAARTKMMLRRDYGLNLKSTTVLDDGGMCIVSFHA